MHRYGDPLHSFAIPHSFCRRFICIRPVGISTLSKSVTLKSNINKDISLLFEASLDCTREYLRKDDEHMHFTQLFRFKKVGVLCACHIISSMFSRITSEGIANPIPWDS